MSVRIHSLRCLLGDGLRGEGLGIPSPLLGCHQVRGAHRAPVMDVPVILQLKFLQNYENVERCLRFRSSTECSNFQLYFRGVFAQCKLCKSWRFHRAVLRRCLRALCCALTGAADGPDSAENREDSACVLGHGCLARRCVTTGAGWSRQCRKLWSLRSWCCSWTKMLMCPYWPRQGVVDVPQLQFIDWWSAHHGYDELMRRLFRAVYTGTRPWLTSAIGAEKEWRGRRELAPRCSATQSSACIVMVYRQRSSIYTQVRTTTTTTNHHNHHSPIGA